MFSWNKLTIAMDACYLIQTRGELILQIKSIDLCAILKYPKATSKIS